MLGFSEDSLFFLLSPLFRLLLLVSDTATHLLLCVLRAGLRWWCCVCVCCWCCYSLTYNTKKKGERKDLLDTQNGALGQRPILDGDDETLPTQSTQRLGLDDHEILALLKQTEEERTCFIQGRGEGKKVLLGEMFGREEENQHPSVLAESGEVRERVHVGAKSEHGRFEGNGEEEKEENDGRREEEEEETYGRKRK